MPRQTTANFGFLDFNSELHARPSIYFSGAALVEHVAVMSPDSKSSHGSGSPCPGPRDTDRVKTRIEYHTEFVTLTRVTMLSEEAKEWPEPTLSVADIGILLDVTSLTVVCQVSILVKDEAPGELGPKLSELGFGDTAASLIGAGAGQVCSDFRVRANGWSHILLFNKDLNAYRLGRMVRRINEIETYRAMALLGFPEARRLAPLLAHFERTLGELARRNQATLTIEHKELLDEISDLSAAVIAASAETRSRFGATVAYAKIVEERIGELREAHVEGFQRFGVFVSRRFRPAVRTCESTAIRLEQLSHATMHLLDLLQTRIQVEIEFQNSIQIQATADRAAMQVKIQRAVEGFSIIAVSYYLVGLLKVAAEASQHAGFPVDPLFMIGSIPVVLAAVTIAVLRVKHALSANV
ncbi:DUF3422 domain-containing protein (plasmid) [Rhizobium binae]